MQLCQISNFLIYRTRCTRKFCTWNPISTILEFPRQLQGIKNCYTRLERNVLKVDGSDASKLIKFLTTNNVRLYLFHIPIRRLTDNKCYTHKTQREDLPYAMFTGFLDDQGRIAYEGFMISGIEPQSFLIDCNASTKLGLMKYMERLKQQYQLFSVSAYCARHNVSITDVSSSYQMWSVFGKDNITVQKLEEIVNTQNKRVFVDPRLPTLGTRMLLPVDTQCTYDICCS